MSATTACPAPDLIKLDTQGAELAILNHGELCLDRAALVLAETWFDRTEYGPQTPLITELNDLLERHDFVLAELGCRFYNERHQFYCCDAFFLKRSFLDTVRTIQCRQAPGRNSEGGNVKRDRWRRGIRSG